MEVGRKIFMMSLKFFIFLSFSCFPFSFRSLFRGLGPPPAWRDVRSYVSFVFHIHEWGFAIPSGGSQVHFLTFTCHFYLYFQNGEVREPPNLAVYATISIGMYETAGQSICLRHSFYIFQE